MKRGIELVSYACNPIILDVFKGIDLSLYNWTSENYYGISTMVDSGKDTRFSPQFIDGNDFKRVVRSEPEYQIDFAELKGFAKDGSISMIDTYEDFLESDCQIMILVNDMIFWEIYIKNPVLLEKVYNNALAFGDYSELTYKTDENDCRTIMHIW